VYGILQQVDPGYDRQFLSSREDILGNRYSHEEGAYIYPVLGKMMEILIPILFALAMSTAAPCFFDVVLMVTISRLFPSFLSKNLIENFEPTVQTIFACDDP
jgi:hypothetical protein